MRYFREKYNSVFGKGAFDRLLRARNKYCNRNYVRINVSKIGQEEVKKVLNSLRVDFGETEIDNCLEIKKSFFNINSIPLALSGYIYNQDFASQLPVHGLKDYLGKLSKGQLRILDMAAAPGSKTTQIADLLGYLGFDYEVVCLEPELTRVRKLINNVQKQCFYDVRVYNARGEHFSDERGFDIVILDAPCSGNLIADKNWLKKRDEAGIKKNMALQERLLKKGLDLLKENGILVYSTCSLEPEENEVVVDKVLRNGSFKLEAPLKLGLDMTPLKEYEDKKFLPEIKKCYRLMPYNSGTQAFFFCYIRKK